MSYLSLDAFSLLLSGEDEISQVDAVCGRQISCYPAADENDIIIEQTKFPLKETEQVTHNEKKRKRLIERISFAFFFRSHSLHLIVFLLPPYMKNTTIITIINIIINNSEQKQKKKENFNKRKVKRVRERERNKECRR